MNPGINKRTKSSFFSPFVLKQTAQLLSRKEDQYVCLQAADGNATGSGESVSLREFVSEFLLRLCTDFHHGICYRSKDLAKTPERCVTVSTPVDTTESSVYVVMPTAPLQLW